VVLGDGVRLTLIGVAAGLVAALAGGRLLENQLYGVPPWDPATYALAIGAVLIAALLACLAPARRAARVDPMIALHAD
jgi:putative ABC transport system permease protein